MGVMDTRSPANPTMEFLVTLWQEGQAWRGTLDIPPSVGVGGAWANEFVAADVSPERIELVQAAGQPGAQPNLFALVRNPVGGDSASGRVIIGGAAEIPARIWKVSPAVARDFMPRRPQLPQPPLPYERRVVEAPNTREGQTVGLQGILTLPPGEGQHPAVVLVNAFDVFDADHTSFGHKPFVVLADRLARAGIATLRTHDRPMSRRGLAPRTQLTIQQLGVEAAERARWLATQPGIDPARIGLVGLNEGGTASVIAANEAGELVRCVVLLAPLAVTGIQQLRDEFSEAIRGEGETAEFAASRAASFIRPYEMLAATAPEQEVVEAINAEMTMQRAARRQQLGEASAEVVSGLAKQQYLIMNTAEFRQGLTFDPAEALSRMTQPALAIIGGKDPRFIAGSNGPALERSLGARQGVESIIRVATSLNHRLQPAQSGSMQEIQEIELTFDEGVLEEVVKFVTRHLNVVRMPKEENR